MKSWMSATPPALTPAKSLNPLSELQRREGACVCVCVCVYTNTHTGLCEEDTQSAKTPETLQHALTFVTMHAHLHACTSGRHREKEASRR
jgi:hypothetical protein